MQVGVANVHIRVQYEMLAGYGVQQFHRDLQHETVAASTYGSGISVAA